MKEHRVAKSKYGNPIAEPKLLSQEDQRSYTKRSRKAAVPNFITCFLGKEQVPLDVCLCFQVDTGIMF
jgi:hypothetical protein